jgi:hypothetical protein
MLKKKEPGFRTEEGYVTAPYIFSFVSGLLFW